MTYARDLAEPRPRRPRAPRRLRPPRGLAVAGFAAPLLAVVTAHTGQLGHPAAVVPAGDAVVQVITTQADSARRAGVAAGRWSTPVVTPAAAGQVAGVGRLANSAALSSAAVASRAAVAATPAAPGRAAGGSAATSTVPGGTQRGAAPGRSAPGGAVAGAGAAAGSGGAAGRPISGGAAVASGAGAAMPGLSIDVNDGRTAVKPGDLLRYVVEVHNIGTTTARHLLLTQTLPPGMRLISASRHGAARAGRVSWWVSLPVGHSGTFRVVGRAGRTPAHLLRLATVACAAADGSIKPVVCAAHSDRLPAGALAAALKPGTAAAGNQTTRRYVTVVVAALVLAALTLIVPRRLALRRRARRLG